MTPRKALLSILWTVVWVPTVLLTIALLTFGDPVEGGYEQRKLIARSMLVVGTAILAAGYWLIFRKRSL